MKPPSSSAFSGWPPGNERFESDLEGRTGREPHRGQPGLRLVSTGWKNGGSGSPGIFKPGQFKPEEVTAYELGTRNTFLDGRVRLNVTAFYYDHEHLQFTYEDPAPFAGGTWTIPETEEYGIESEMSWLLAEGWQLDGMLAWQDGKVKSDVFALGRGGFSGSDKAVPIGPVYLGRS